MILPTKDRKKGIGLGLIGRIYEISKILQYNLVLVQMTDGFYAAMLRRGAVKTSFFDALQIVDTTNLN